MGPFIVLFGASAILLWLVFLVVCVCVVSSLENDSPGWATFSIGVTFAVLWFFTDFSIRYDILSRWSWQVVFALAFGYAICGVLWSFFKWFLALSERRAQWDEVVREYRDKYNVAKEIPVTVKNDQRFEDYVKEHHREFVDTKGYSSNSWTVRVRPRPNKARIVGWIAYWPWSLLWSICDDLFMNIASFMYRHLVGAYDNMSKWMFRGIED